ncbi:DUF6505 family protein [Arenibaculum pallidiluteum]|uniref:DUF6505 family protein n=1 Tax=Arenibaculum pallidiluteum TaxID=2812559 RepID=UPI001A9707B4|nr:DUF6505 family protein [Arenibaculum pallidiluteum]
MEAGGGALRLPRTIRMDGSDLQVFGRAAEPGEWAVSGAFAFLNRDPATVAGKERQAFANGFLGIASLGWSSFVVVSEATEAEREEVVRTLAQAFLDHWGAPSFEAAEPVAREEVAFAQSLCAKHPVNTLLAVTREWDGDGIKEGFRTVRAPREAEHARIWTIEPEDGFRSAEAQGIDLVKLAGGRT